MKRHTVVGMARKKLSLYHLEPRQRKVTNKTAFRIDSKVIEKVTDPISREILTQTFIQKKPQLQIIEELAKQKGIRVVEAKDLFNQAMEEGKEIALHSPQNIVKRKYKKKVLDFNWENPSSAQKRRFEKAFNEGLDRKREEQLQNERVISAYKRGEDLPDIMSREKIHSIKFYKILGPILKEHPEIKEARKQMREKVEAATKKYLLPSQRGRPRTLVQKEVIQRETILTPQSGKKRGRKPSKGTIARNRKARVKWEARRHERIIRNYKAGADIKNLVPGYHTTPGSAYLYARRMAKKDASIDEARKQLKKQPTQKVMPQPSEKRRGVIERRLISTLRKEGILRAYSQGQKHNSIAPQFGVTKTASQQTVSMFKRDHPELKEGIERNRRQAKQNIKLKKTTVKKRTFLKPGTNPREEGSLLKKRGRKPGKGTLARNRKARVLLANRRHERIIRNYKAGADLKNLAPGYNTTPGSAYFYANTAAKNDSSIREAREKVLRARELEERERMEVQSEYEKEARKREIRVFDPERSRIKKQQAEEETKRKRERDRVIIERYKQGLTMEEMARGFDITPQSAASLASVYARDDPRIREARKNSIDKLRKEHPELFSGYKRKKIPSQETLEKRAQRKLELEKREEVRQRQRKAEKLRREHQQKWVGEHYRYGTNVLEIGKGYGLRQDNARQVLYRAKSKDPSIEQDRRKNLREHPEREKLSEQGRLMLENEERQKIRQRELRAQGKNIEQWKLPRIPELPYMEKEKYVRELVGKTGLASVDKGILFRKLMNGARLTIEEVQALQPERKFNPQKLVKHASFNEWSASARMFEDALQKGEVRPEDFTVKKTYPIRIQAIRHLLSNPKGIIGLDEISDYLVKRKIAKNKNDAAKAMGELVDMGAVDRVSPRGFRIRDEWLELPPEQQVKVVKEQRFVEVPRVIHEITSKSKPWVTGNMRERLQPWVQKREAALIVENRNFAEEAAAFIKREKIDPVRFDRMIKYYKENLASLPNQHPEMIAERIMRAEGAQKANLPYAVVSRFATWAVGSNYPELGKVKKEQTKTDQL